MASSAKKRDVEDVADGNSLDGTVPQFGEDVGGDLLDGDESNEQKPSEGNSANYAVLPQGTQADHLPQKTVQMILNRSKI